MTGGLPPHEAAQAYELILACRLNYETPAESDDFVKLLGQVLPEGMAVPTEPLAAPQQEPLAEVNETEQLYRRALSVWSHPGVVEQVRQQAHAFLLRYLAGRQASPSFVAAVCDEAMLVIERCKPMSGHEGKDR